MNELLNTDRRISKQGSNSIKIIMRKLFRVPAIFLIILFFSCSKKNSKKITFADGFVGNWAVSESVTGSTNASDEFNSKSFKQNDSTFGVIESNRSPTPIWVNFGNLLDLDTIYFQPASMAGKLYSSSTNNSGIYSLNKDTLTFAYDADISIGTWTVNQIWVKE